MHGSKKFHTLLVTPLLRTEQTRYFRPDTLPCLSKRKFRGLGPEVATEPRSHARHVRKLHSAAGIPSPRSSNCFASTHNSLIKLSLRLGWWTESKVHHPSRKQCRHRFHMPQRIPAKQLACHLGYDDWTPRKWPAGVVYSTLIDEKVISADESVSKMFHLHNALSDNPTWISLAPAHRGIL